MTQFSYMMLRLYGRGNFTLESEMAKQNFESQAVEKLMAVKSILPNMDRMLWKCDPNVPNERLTFEKLTMLQVINSEPKFLFFSFNQRYICRLHQPCGTLKTNLDVSLKLI